MWARKIGLPPLWPSRLKVLIMGIIAWWTASQVARLLQDAEVGWLDLENANQQYATCKNVLQECQNNTPEFSPLECIVNESNTFIHYNMTYVLPGSCSVKLPGQKCDHLDLPIGYGQTAKGKLHALTRFYNPFQFWGMLFLVFSSLLILAVVFHDLVLLSKRNRPRILALLSMKQEFPKLWRAQQILRLSRRMHTARLEEPLKWKLLLLPHVLWQLLIFLVFIYPVCVLCCILFPMRMCRLGVFVSGINMALWALVLMSRVYWWSEYEHWEVFFDASDVLRHLRHGHKLAVEELENRCICYCEHPLSTGIKQRLVMLAVLVLIQSFSLTFRSLKGLRQARWACLFTVTYTLPIEVFPVEWGRPEEKGGGPIQHRKEGEEVQGEPAFDAFALMDEQPESWRSTVKLMPVLETREEAERNEWNTHAKNSMDRDIRCCGFPKFHGVKDYDFGGPDQEDDESESALEDANKSSPDDSEDETEEDSTPRVLPEDWQGDKLGKWHPYRPSAEDD